MSEEIRILKDAMQKEVNTSDYQRHVVKVGSMFRSAAETLIKRTQAYHTQTGLNYITGAGNGAISLEDRGTVAIYDPCNNAPITFKFILESPGLPQRELKVKGKSSRSAKYSEWSFEDLAKDYLVGHMTGSFEGTNYLVDQLTQSLKIVNSALERNEEGAKKGLAALEEALEGF